MRRLNEDGGAVAVLVALMLVALLGIGAIVIDAGALYVERRELQNGADAAALAVARDCAAGSCGNAEAMALSFAGGNANDGRADATVAFPQPGRVLVTTTTRTAAGGSALAHWLAPLIGTDATTVEARASAAWGRVGGGGTLPLTISVCEWNLLTGFDSETGARTLPTGPTVVYFHTQTQSENNRCDGPAGQDVPGGFGWLDVDRVGACEAQVQAGSWIGGDTGNSPPRPGSATGCTDSHFAGLLGETALLPIFAEIQGTGESAEYWIEGLAAFEITGYRFGGSSPVANAPCGNPHRCVGGRFVAFYDLTLPLDPDAPDYGVIAVNLVE